MGDEMPKYRSTTSSSPRAVNRRVGTSPRRMHSSVSAWTRQITKARQSGVSSVDDSYTGLMRLRLCRHISNACPEICSAKVIALTESIRMVGRSPRSTAFTDRKVEIAEAARLWPMMRSSWSEPGSYSQAKRAAVANNES